MNRRVSLVSIGVLVASLGMIATDEGTASARTLHASSGTPMVGSNMANFTVAGPGVTPTVASPGNWIFPIMFDNPGARTITVQGRLNPGSGMGCLAAAMSSSGAISSSTSLVPFNPSGAWQSIALNLSFVPAGAQGVVVCSWSGTGGTLLGFAYNP